MCSLPMGMGSAYIPPHAISASSEMNDQNSPTASRITQDTNDGDKGWRPQDSTPNEWLQVYFGTRSKITGIATKGIKDQQLWVKWYQIEYLEQRKISDLIDQKESFSNQESCFQFASYNDQYILLVFSIVCKSGFRS